MLKAEKIQEWREENKDCFNPPICNKLMHKGQLSIMFVGGPNTRTDFHIDESSEFFYQISGNIELPTIQQGKRKLVKIREGDVFLLPSRIPHSPQRPETGSFGLVVERERAQGELDGLRWYTDFTECSEILWERFFQCNDLGRDLVPVVQAFKASEECATGKPGGNHGNIASPEVHADKQDFTTVVPDPFNIDAFIEEHRQDLSDGHSVPLFMDHPDKEFSIMLLGGGMTSDGEVMGAETFILQLRGSATVTTVDSGRTTTELSQGSCMVVPAHSQFSVTRAADAVCLVLSNRPGANRL